MMKHAKRYLMLASSVAVLVVGLTGCPVPAFNLSGEYEGTMNAVVEGVEKTCPMTMTLIHVPQLLYPASFQVGGFVDFELLCIFDQEELADALETLPALTIPVLGELSDDGTNAITLGIDTESLALPYTVAFSCNGTGTDTDGDGNMDEFAGTYTLSLIITTAVEGYEEIDFTIEEAFSVALVE